LELLRRERAFTQRDDLPAHPRGGRLIDGEVQIAPTALDQFFEEPVDGGHVTSSPVRPPPGERPGSRGPPATRRTAWRRRPSPCASGRAPRATRRGGGRRAASGAAGGSGSGASARRG